MPFPLPFRALLTDCVEEVLPINHAIIFNYNCCQQLLRITEFLFVSGAFLISSEHGDVKGWYMGSREHVCDVAVVIKWSQLWESLRAAADVGLGVYFLQADPGRAGVTYDKEFIVCSLDLLSGLAEGLGSSIESLVCTSYLTHIYCNSQFSRQSCAESNTCMESMCCFISAFIRHLGFLQVFLCGCVVGSW